MKVTRYQKSEIITYIKCKMLVELGFVISKQASKIKKEDYLDYIEAYFVCLDLTDRNFQLGKFIFVKINSI